MGEGQPASCNGLAAMRLPSRFFIRFLFTFETLVLFWVSVDGRAQSQRRPYYPGGTMIELGPYDPASRTFLVISTVVPAQGPFYATIDEVLKVFPNLDPGRIRKRPDTLVGQQLLTQREIFILADSEVDELRAKSRKRSPASPVLRTGPSGTRPRHPTSN